MKNLHRIEPGLSEELIAAIWRLHDISQKPIGLDSNGYYYLGYPNNTHKYYFKHENKKFFEMTLKMWYSYDKPAININEIIHEQPT